MNKVCLYCKTELKGRQDKKFCNSYCKSSYHYEKTKEQQPTLYTKVDRQLKTNRRILKQYNKSGLSTVRKEKLTTEGFNPQYFTNYWKNTKGEVYLFCYEFGFKEIKKGLNTKYVLVTWQPYMEIS